jgi:polyhydroxyalkanoate synthesis regulator phasin
METGKMAKQMIDFYKSTFDNSFNSMVMLQEQMEKTLKTSLDQATWLPEEGKKVLDDWVKAYKQGREELKKAVDENFKKVEDFFNASSTGGK